MFSVIGKANKVIERRDKRKVILYILFSCIASVIDLFGVAILFDFFSILSSRSTESTIIAKASLYMNLDSFASKHFELLAFALVVTYLLRAVVMFFTNNYLQLLLMSIFDNVLKRQLKNNVLLPMTKHLNRNLNELSHRIHAHSIHFVSYFLQPLLSMATELFIIGLIFLTLLIVEPLATVVTFSLMMILAIFYIVNIRVKVRALARSLDNSSISLFTFVRSAMESFKEIKIYGALNYYLGKVSQKCQTYSKSFIRFNQMMILPKIVFESFVPILISVIALVLYFSVDNKEQVFTRFLFIAMGFARVAPSFSRLTSLMSSFASHSISVDIVHEGIFGETKKDKSINNPFPSDKGSLVLKDIKFNYNEEKEVLKGVNLEINYGEKIGIVGKSGAGKSTLLYIILGILRPIEGSVEYSNVSIENNRNWFNLISYIPQSIHLLDSSIEENVAFGISLDEIDSEVVKKSLIDSQLYEDVKDFLFLKHEHDESSLDVEMSKKLSGGQVQRLAIARALYRRSPVLIVDEGTSSLDVETEYKVNQTILDSSADKTVIFVSHRINSLKGCDRIIVIDDGRVVADGSYKQLQDKSEWFKLVSELSS